MSKLQGARVAREGKNAQPSEVPDLRTVRIDIPGTTFRSPNKQVWSGGAALSAGSSRKRMRSQVAICVRAHLHELPKSHYDRRGLLATVRATLVRISSRPFDDDNFVASAKPARDAVADAFGLRDDSPLLSFSYRQERTAPGRKWTTGLIVYLEPAA